MPPRTSHYSAFSELSGIFSPSSGHVSPQQAHFHCQFQHCPPQQTRAAASDAEPTSVAQVHQLGGLILCVFHVVAGHWPAPGALRVARASVGHVLVVLLQVKAVHGDAVLLLIVQRDEAELGRRGGDRVARGHALQADEDCRHQHTQAQNHVHQPEAAEVLKEVACHHGDDHLPDARARDEHGGCPPRQGVVAVGPGHRRGEYGGHAQAQRHCADPQHDGGGWEAEAQDDAPCQHEDQVRHQHARGLEAACDENGHAPAHGDGPPEQGRQGCPLCTVPLDQVRLHSEHRDKATEGHLNTHIEKEEDEEQREDGGAEAGWHRRGAGPQGGDLVKQSARPAVPPVQPQEEQRIPQKDEANDHVGKLNLRHVLHGVQGGRDHIQDLRLGFPRGGGGKCGGGCGEGGIG